MCLAIPGRVVEFVDGGQTSAVVDVCGVRRRVELGLLADNLPLADDWVLIHVGFAMSRISEAEAMEQMRTLTLLGEGEAAIEEVRGYGVAADAAGSLGPDEGGGKGS